MLPSSMDRAEINQLIALNQKSIPAAITITIQIATAEFAGMKYKMKADTGVGCLNCVENIVIKPIICMLPKLEKLALCEEKYSYTPNDCKDRKKNDNSISHLKEGSALISGIVFCQSLAAETEEGKRHVSNYLADNVNRLNSGRTLTSDTDSELHKEKNVSM